MRSNVMQAIKQTKQLYNNLLIDQHSIGLIIGMHIINIVCFNYIIIIKRYQSYIIMQVMIVVIIHTFCVLIFPTKHPQRQKMVQVLAA